MALFWVIVPNILGEVIPFKNKNTDFILLWQDPQIETLGNKSYFTATIRNHNQPKMIWEDLILSMFTIYFDLKQTFDHFISILGMATKANLWP